VVYITLGDCWFHIIVLNIHVPTEDKIDDVKDSFYKELEHELDKFPKYHTKILSEDFNQQLGRKVYVKLVITMESD
jgi:RNase P/RNase MRP subunit p30